MKKKHMLSELVELATTQCRRAAMEAYLVSTTHRDMQIACSSAEECDEGCRKLLKGDISPHLDICCCADMFATALTHKPKIFYKGLELPLNDNGLDMNDENWDMFPEDEPVDDATFEKLAKLPASDLRQKLEKEFLCAETEYVCRHEADAKAQCQYYDAVMRRFEAAAQYAKAIGSESARLWLEAICLLSPRRKLKKSERAVIGLDLVPDCVVQAYEVAERAQRALWVDNSLRKLPAAKLSRKTGKKHC